MACDGFGFFADEPPDLGQATQVGVDAEMVGHPGRVSRWVEGRCGPIVAERTSVPRHRMWGGGAPRNAIAMVLK